MSMRSKPRFQANTQSNLSRSEKLRAYAKKATQFDNHRRVAWQQKREARVARYREAFKGAWITKIGLGMAAIIELLRKPFALRKATPDTRRSVMERRNPNAFHASNRELRLEGLVARQLLAADVFLDDAAQFDITTDVAPMGISAGDTVTWYGFDQVARRWRRCHSP